MGSLQEALLKNGVFYFENDGTNYTIESGSGNYMIARDASGIVRYRIEGSELNSDLIIRDVNSGTVAFRVSPSKLFF